jgi:hypothetical protein
MSGETFENELSTKIARSILEALDDNHEEALKILLISKSKWSHHERRLQLSPDGWIEISGFPDPHPESNRVIHLQHLVNFLNCWIRDDEGEEDIANRMNLAKLFRTLADQLEAEDEPEEEKCEGCKGSGFDGEIPHACKACNGIGLKPIITPIINPEEQ